MFHHCSLCHFLLVGLSLHVLVFLLYRHDPHGPEVRFAAVVTGVLGVVSLAAALLVWMEINLAAKTAAQAPVRAYAESAEGDSGAEQ